MAETEMSELGAGRVAPTLYVLCGFSPNFAADLISFSNFGHASGSRSRFDVLFLVGLDLTVLGLDFSMHPQAAFEIALTHTELQMLGEITAILGQIDYIMVSSVGGLASVSRETASAIMGSSRIADSVNIWASITRERAKVPAISGALDIAIQMSKSVTEGRNDFIHALYGYGAVEHQLTSLGNLGGLTTLSPQSSRVAVRVRNQKRRSVKDIETVRNMAAELSCLVRLISVSHQGLNRETQELFSRLSPELQSRLGMGLSPSAKGSTEQPGPSQASP